MWTMFAASLRARQFYMYNFFFYIIENIIDIYLVIKFYFIYNLKSLNLMAILSIYHTYNCISQRIPNGFQSYTLI